MHRDNAAWIMAGFLLLSAGCRGGKPDAVEAGFDPRSRTRPSYLSRLENVIMHAVPDIKVQEPLIRSLPDYTRILLLSPDYKEKDTRRQLAEMNIDGGRVTLLSYGGDDMWRGYWAQDMFEVLGTDMSREIMLPGFFTFDSYYDYMPLPYEPTQETEGFGLFLSRQGYATRIIPEYFEGGNIAYDRFEGRDILFLGADNLIDEDTFREYNLLLDEGIHTSRDSIYLQGDRRRRAVQEYGEAFGADRVLVLGEKQYATHMFHLDQSFLEIGPGEVVILDLSSLTETDLDEIAADFSADFAYLSARRDELLADSRIGYEEFLFLEKFPYLAEAGEVRQILSLSRKTLQEIRETFEELGYDIHLLRQDPYQNLHYQSYVNAIVYTDRVTSRKTILMPIFPGMEGNYDPADPFNKSALEFYQSLGLVVIPVVNYTWASGGNNHCLINIYD